MIQNAKIDRQQLEELYDKEKTDPKTYRLEHLLHSGRHIYDITEEPA